MLRRSFFGFIILLLLGSCSTSSVLVDIQRPADITLGKDIKNVVVVNRSRPSKDNLAENIFEGLITGEGFGVDRKGAEYCVRGLANILSKSERFNLKNIEAIELKGTGTSAFSVPLSSTEVRSICSSYQSDALLVLETFDSDSRVRIGAPVTRTKKVKKIKIKEVFYPAILTMSIESGWRIYEAETGRIIDENKFTEVKEFNASGATPKIAEQSLPSKRNAIEQSGVFAGEQYGFRISPIWIKVRRVYYTGKSDALKRAKSYVKTGDWDSAIDIWKEVVNSSNVKTAKRAAYNMAVASEIKEGLDAAIEWAKRAHSLGEKKASSYINILKKRKIDRNKLKQQLN